MHVKSIIGMLKSRPFQPFRVILSSGDRFEIRHPENAIIGKEGVLISYTRSPRGSLNENYTICSYLHIAAIEPLQQQAKEIN